MLVEERKRKKHARGKRELSDMGRGSGDGGEWLERERCWEAREEDGGMGVS